MTANGIPDASVIPIPRSAGTSVERKRPIRPPTSIVAATIERQNDGLMRA